MRSTLFAFTLLAGLAGTAAVTPADAAPLAHGLSPSLAALLPATDMSAPAVLTEGTATVQEVQYRRRRYYRRHHRRGYRRY